MCPHFKTFVSAVSFAWKGLTQIITGLIHSLYSCLCSKNKLSEALLTIQYKTELPAPLVTLKCLTLIFFFISALIPGGSVGKESTCNAGDLRDVGSILGLGRSPGEGITTHSSILAWRILWVEEPNGLQSIGSWTVGRSWGNRSYTRGTHHQWHVHLLYLIIFIYILFMMFHSCHMHINIHNVSLNTHTYTHTLEY